MHKGFGSFESGKKVLKAKLKKNYRTQKSTQKRRCTQKSTKKSELYLSQLTNIGGDIISWLKVKKSW